MKTSPVMSALTVAMSLTISSCATNGSPGAHAKAVAKKNTAAADLAAGTVTTKTPAVTPLDKVTCENPISLDDPKLKPLTQKSDFADVKYKVSHMQIYWLDESTNNSYIASTDGPAGDPSSVHLDCNGIQGLSTESFFKATSEMNVFTGVQANTQWAIDVKFEKGSLAAVSGTHFVKDKPTAEKPGDNISLERTKVGDDMFVTIRYYALPSGKLEVRMKTEFKADANGKRLIQYATAIYEAK